MHIWKRSKDKRLHGMAASGALTLGKEERISGKKPIDELFNGGDSRSMSAYPIRLVSRVYVRQGDMPQARMMVSVPKRLLKKAVERNRVKRQVREAYRSNKHIVLQALADQPEKAVDMAFIWLSNGLAESSKVNERMARLLRRISEKL